MITQPIIKSLVIAAALTAVPSLYAKKLNCLALSNTVKVAVAAEKSSVLELVSTHVAQNESCACEIVQAAIVASDADTQLVADITEAAIVASPSQMRLIGQCSVAVAPDAFDKVQAVLDNYSGNNSAYAGDTYSSKGESNDKGSDKDAYSSKGGSDKDAVAADHSAPSQDPRDLPGFSNGEGGGEFISTPGTGGFGGSSILSQQPPILVVPETGVPTTPPPSATPEVTF